MSKIKEHMKCHSQEKLVGCPQCGGMFANRIKFFDHCMRQQSNVKNPSFICTKCNKAFTIERHLRDHMRAHINYYKCNFCDMTCPSPSTLKNHIRYRHVDVKPYSCEFCEYRGKTPGDIKSHVRIHFNEVEIVCPEENCNYKCRAKLTMKQHRKSAHAKEVSKYACHLCDVKCDRGAAMTKHLTKIHLLALPSGHSRFRYTKDNVTGFYCLQTFRYESVELRQEVNILPPAKVKKEEDMEYSVSIENITDSRDILADLVVSESLQCGPLSVQSCPEMGVSEDTPDVYIQPWSVHHDPQVVEQELFS